jgi:hypothetical protein
VQAHVRSLIDRNFLLQELLIRIDLDRKEIRDIQDARQLPEVFPNTLLFSERVGHACDSHDWSANELAADYGLACDDESDENGEQPETRRVPIRPKAAGSPLSAA